MIHRRIAEILGTACGLLLQLPVVLACIAIRWLCVRVKTWKDHRR